MKKKSGIYDYLNSSGAFNSGKIEDIEAARKQYWREYKSAWRKSKRQKQNEFTIYCSDDETNQLTVSAKVHHMSRTKFLKEACFAYMDQKFIVPDEHSVRQIRQQVTITCRTIEAIAENSPVELSFLIDTLNHLKKEVKRHLVQPVTIEELIRQTVQSIPEKKISLIEYIQSL